MKAYLIRQNQDVLEETLKAIKAREKKKEKKICSEFICNH